MQRPEYEALDGNGLPHIREARVVHELPTPEARGDALRSATQSIAQLLQITARRTIPFGAPVFVAFGLTRPQAKAHKLAQLLLTKGEDLSLDHCPQYNTVMSRTPVFVLQADADTGVTLIAGCSGSGKSMAIKAALAAAQASDPPQRSR